MVNKKSDKKTDDGKNKKICAKNKNPKKSQKSPPHNKTIHVHNYFGTTNKKTTKTRTFATQMPRRGIDDFGFAKTSRNRQLQTEPDLPPATALVSGPLNSQMKILEAISEIGEIIDLLTRFINDKETPEEDAKIKKTLEDVFTGFFASEKDFKYKLDNCCRSFEFFCWFSFVNDYFRSGCDLVDYDKLIEIFVKKFFTEEIIFTEEMID